MRRDARKDANQTAIVQALRRMGVDVKILNAPGLPVLLVGFRHRTFLFEVKTPEGALTWQQKLFFDTWRGQARVVQTLEEIREVLGC
jgi:hypothetical protein